MTDTADTNLFDIEIEALQIAKHLCLLNKRLIPGAALMLARTALTDAAHICNDCLSEILKEHEKAHPEHFKPKKKKIGIR